MAGIEELEQWDNEVYQLETTDPVEGGDDGVDNVPHKALANRTKWLKTQVASKALLGGSDAQKFKVKNATLDNEAVSFLQAKELSQGYKNKLINPHFAISQDGTSFTNPNGYMADQWIINKVGVGTLNVGVYPPTHSDRGYTYIGIYGTDLSHTDKSILQQRMEYGELFENKEFTLSLDTDNTSYLQDIDVYVEYGEVGNTENYQRVQVGTISSNGSETLTFVTPNITIATASGKMGDMYFALRLHIPNPENRETIRIKTVQLEPGDIATPFEHIDPGNELIMCQRFFEKYVVASGNNAFGKLILTQTVTNNTWCTEAVFPFLVEKRVNPAITLYSNNTAGAVSRNNVAVSATNSDTTSRNFSALYNTSGSDWLVGDTIVFGATISARL